MGFLLKVCWIRKSDNRIENQVPLQSLCISLGSVLLIIFITMFYTTGKLKKENIIDALRGDNI
ncbi:MAG: hypothetical protein MR443_09185 [Lachnospiraceae bacterium]|nr:hypothetical protein [Lachnospiraceae bacterium]